MIRQLHIFMPSESPRQLRFMRAVHAMQLGKMPKSGKAGKAADEMDPKDVEHFLMQECGFGKCNVDVKRRILKGLQELIEPMRLQEVDSSVENIKTPNVIASAKTLYGDFDNTLKMYRGFELTPKENQAIQNFDEARPVIHDKFKVQYNKSDDFTNTSTIVVKKLREQTGHFVYTAIIKVRGGKEEPKTPEPKPGETQQQPAEPSEDEIKLVKSVPIDDKEGSEILTNFLQAVYHQQA